MLIDASYKGAPGNLMVQANRNGFIYVLDRTNGEFLSAQRFVDNLNWAKGIDVKGRPIVTGLHHQPTEPGSAQDLQGRPTGSRRPTTSGPSLFTFLRWRNAKFSFSSRKTSRKERPTIRPVRNGLPEKSRKVLLAFDLRTLKPAWKYPQVGPAHSSGGTMTTAGGLVFFGDDAQSFEAVDARTGKPLWHFNTGQTFSASPMSYAVEGKQYVAIAAGTAFSVLHCPKRVTTTSEIDG